MKSDYRKDLEKIARQMILIHRADILIKLVLRLIVRNLKVSHAGILIYEKERDEYVVRVSRGHTGFKIPVGFVKVNKTNPLIRYFTDRKLDFTKDFILFDKIKSLLRVTRKAGTRRFLEDLEENLTFYQARVCIPGFFRKDLIGVLFLGAKTDGRKFSEKELGFLSVLASDVVMALENAWLIEDLNRQLAANKRLFLQMISALASSIEAKDKYTKGHTERVVNYCLGIANNLSGSDLALEKESRRLTSWNKFLEDLKISALLHDIGKIGIPETVLNKPSSLNEEERRVVQRHPLIGVEILRHIDELVEALLGVKHHHERYDGSGYPTGLKGRQISLIAAVICLADAFDAMTTDRPYRKALSPEAALAEIKGNKGKQFAPSVVEAFLKYIHSRNLVDLT